MSDEPRHIALLLPELEAGGAQRVMLLLAREFAARGHRIDLVLLNARGPLLAEVPSNVRLIDLGARTYGLGQLGLAISSVSRLAAWLRQERPHALLSTLTGANLVAILARRRTRIPHRLVIREAITLNHVTSRFRLAAMRRLYRDADSVVALTSVMRTELRDALGIADDRLAVIANPVDIDRLRAYARHPLSAFETGNPATQIVLAVGRLIPQKDYPTLLRAFARIPPALGARLVIVGEGPERKALEHLALDLGIGKSVSLPGFDANPWRWMARAQLFVLSSRWEGHPNALLEALALGLPAVVTEYDRSAREFLGSGETLIVPPQDPARMAEAIAALLAPPSPRSRQGLEPAPQAAIDSYLELLADPPAPSQRQFVDLRGSRSNISRSHSATISSRR